MSQIDRSSKVCAMTESEWLENCLVHVEIYIISPWYVKKGRKWLCSLVLEHKIMYCQQWKWQRLNDNWHKDKQLWIKLSLFLQPQNNNHIFHNKFNCLWALDLFAWAKCQNNQLQCQNPTSITTWSQASYFPAIWTGHVKLLRVLIEQFFFRFVNAVCFLDLWFQGHSALIQQFFSLDVFRFVNAVCFFDL